MRAGRGWLNGRRPAVQWATLASLSLVFVVVAYWLSLPAASMVGPLVAAIVVSVNEGSIKLPTLPFVSAQGIIGCMIGSSIPLTFFSDIAGSWPLFTFAILSTIAAASGVGYLLTRYNIFPGTTAIWGTSPGASTPMIVMSEEYGADVRLVAVMQMLRVACVIAVAAVVARMWGSGTSAQAAVAASAPGTVWFPAVPFAGLATTLVGSVGAALLAFRLRIPAGAMLVPVAITLMLHELGWLEAVLPPWLLAASYTLVGWNIGLRFTRPILAHAFMALPRILASICALMALCGLIAVVLVYAGGVDPLTAYLATCPGGADSIAIIAASSNVDLRFVITMQMTRLVIVMMVAPWLSRFVARYSMASGAAKPLADGR